MVSPRQAEGGGDTGGGKDCQECLGGPVEAGQGPTVETEEVSGSFLTPSEAPVRRRVLGAGHLDTNKPRLCPAVAHRLCDPPLLLPPAFGRF